jgi:TatA/E family protein of Tat protein translocase
MSMGEIFVVLLVALLVFGGRLPDTARKLGSTLSEFKRGMREEMRKVEDGIRKDEPPPAWRPPPGDAKAGAPEEPSPPGP